MVKEAKQCLCTEVIFFSCGPKCLLNKQFPLIASAICSKWITKITSYITFICDPQNSAQPMSCSLVLKNAQLHFALLDCINLLC